MPTYSTRSLLQCAALAAAGGLIVVLAGPLTTWIALLSAPLYAVVGSMHMLAPMIALRWTRLPWAATITALLGALIAMPFSVLGVLIVPALVLPALAIDAVVLLVRPRGRTAGLYAGALAGGFVIFVISFAVIPADEIGPGLVLALFVLRLASYAAAMRLSAAVVTGLRRAGVRPATGASSARLSRQPESS